MGATKDKRTAKAAKKASRKSHPASVSGLPKAEAKKALDAATKAIRALKKKADQNYWHIGRRLNVVAELELHKSAGLATIGDYADQKLEISRATAFSYMRVAAAFGEEVATTFGAAKLDKALAYIAATPEEETAHDVPKLHVRVLDESGQVHEKLFTETSTRELQAAAAHEKATHAGKKPKRKPAVSAKVLTDVARANRALDRAVEKSNAARADVSVRTHDGEVLIDVRGVPIGVLAKSLAAVAKVFG